MTPQSTSAKIRSINFKIEKIRFNATVSRLPKWLFFLLLAFPLAQTSAQTCTGTPTAGKAMSNTATACPASSFTLTLSGASSTGIQYQWQSAPDNTTWTNISGATTASYTATESASEYFRCNLTCTTSRLSAASTSVFIPFTLACYCTPTYYYNSLYGSNSATNAMTKVAIIGYGGSTLTDNFTPNASGYLDRTAAVTAVNMALGGTYSVSVTYNHSNSYYEDQIWIDFNNDGVFSPSEAVTPVFGAGGCSTTVALDGTNITIPASATPGLHRMRIRNAYSNTTCYNSTAMDPCNVSDAAKYYIYGAAADYMVNIVSPAACTGTPVGGICNSSATTAGSGTVINLTLSGSSASGVTFQWQSAPDNSSWTSISGGTSSSWSLSETSSTYYRCVLTCTASSLTANAASVYVDYTANSYCIPTYYYYVLYGTSAYTAAMNKVTISGNAGSSLNDGFAPSIAGYVDRTATAGIVNLAQGGSYAGTVYYDNLNKYYENQIWIDLNDDGIFSPSEAMTPVFGAGGCTTNETQDSFNINIPLSAIPGIHRMRVRNVWSNSSCYNSTSMSPCGDNDASKNYTYGSTVDYLVNIVAPPACSGVPVGGYANSSTTTACYGTSINLTLTGASASGINYQWQSAPDNSIWTNLSGATTASYTLTETAGTYYRCKLTCTVSGMTDSSASVSVPYSATCYCTPSYLYNVLYGTPASNDAIDAISITGYSGSVLTDVFAPTTAGYLDRTAAATIVNFAQGGNYAGTVFYNNTNEYYENQIWIDFNNDGIFESSEAVTPVFGLGGCTTNETQDTFRLNIALSAAPGLHRMRVRNAWSNTNCYLSTSMNPCDSNDASKNYIIGGTVDYMVNIVAPPPCTGTPAEGTANSGIGTACAGSVINLTLSGASSSGINYQWQSAPDGTSWTNISGATAAALNATESTNTYYRCNLTCSYSGLADSSTSVYVPYSSTCYCVPTYLYNVLYGTAASSDAMNKVTITGYGGSSLNDPFAPSNEGYLDRTTTATIVNLAQGGSYPGMLFYDNSNEYYENQIWIDFNNDGVFETSEALTPVFGAGGCTTSETQDSFRLNIALTAPLGLHRMRVRNAWSNTSCYNSTNMSPCGYSDASKSYIYGSAVDYMINIVAPPLCSGTPVAGTANSSVGTAVLDSTFTLSLTGASASGIAYQWQSSANGTTWSNIAGATTASWNLYETGNNFYRCNLTCVSDTITDSSAPVYVPYSTTGYCVPSYQYYNLYGTSAGNEAMNKVVINGYSGSILNDPFAPSAAGYLDRTITAGTISLAQGGTYTGNVYYDNSNEYYENQIWIDFNNDGIFETSEALTPVFGNGGCSTSESQDSFRLNISLSAPLGLHRMRVRNAWSNTNCYNSTAMSPCGYSDASKTYIYGSTVDYMINIVAPPLCSGIPAAGIANSSVGTACADTLFTLSLTGASSSGINYQWQSSPDNTSWTNISGATTAGWSLYETGNYYYRCELTCASNGYADSSASVYVPYSPICYCTPSYQYYNLYGTAASNDAMNKVVINGYSGSILSDPFAPSAQGYLDRTITAGTINMAQGGNYSGILYYDNANEYYENQIWIDINNDGIFESSEALTGVFGSGLCSTSVAQDSFHLNIALTAPLGLHRMRIRNAWSNTSCYNSPTMSPCGYSDASKTYIYGSTVDYLINIVTPPLCSGTPASGTAMSSIGTASGGTAFTLSLSGASSSGINYQWQSSTDNIAWNNISGATAASYSLTETSSYYYRCNLTCSGSGIMSSSTSIYVPYSSGSYCTPTYANNVSYGVSSGSNAVYKINMSGYSGSAIIDSFAPTSAGYLDRTTTVPAINLMQGNNYLSSLFYDANNSAYENQIWIDFNNDGTFSAAEAISPVFGTGNCTTNISKDTTTVTIPNTASVGIHRMRIRNALMNSCPKSAAMNPCGQFDATRSYLLGSTTDYLVNIVPLPCSGTPTGGTAISSISNGCLPYNTALGITGSTVATGLTYQWSSSTNGSTYTAVSGATTLLYTIADSAASVYYRCTVTCPTSGGNVTSTAIHITGMPSPTLTVNALPDTICNGATTTLSVTGGLTYNWLPATLVSPATGATVVASPTTSTTFTVQSVNSYGCPATLSKKVYVNPSPIAITGPSNICTGTIYTLTCSAGGSWSSGNTSVAGINSVTGTLSAIATGSTTITYALPGGCSSILNETVSAIPTATLTAVSATNICAGNAESLNISGSPNAAVAFSPSGNITLNGSGTGTYTFIPTTSGIYSLASVSLNGCSQAGAGTAAFTLTAMPSANITALSTSAICAGSVATLSLTGTPNSTIAFSPSGTTTLSASGSATYTISPVSTTIYTISSASLSGCAQAGRGSATLVVNQVPNITAFIVPTICVGAISAPFSFSATASPSNYGLSWNAAALSAGFTNISSAALTGTPIAINIGSGASAGNIYTGRITLTNAGGCSSSQNFNIPVTALPTSGSITASLPAVCNGGTTTLSTGTPVGGTGLPTSYTWSYSDPTAAIHTLGTYTTNSLSVSPGSAGPGNYVYSVTTSMTGSGCSATGSQTVQVAVQPTASVSVSSNNICTGTSLIISSTLFGGAGLFDATISGPIATDGSRFATTGTGLATSATYSAVYTPTVSSIGAYTLTASFPAGTGCSLSPILTSPVTFTHAPTINLNAVAPICQGGSSDLIGYSGTTGSPGTYNINWNSAALTAGFTNDSSALLPVSAINVAVPPTALAATYTASISVSNGQTCNTQPVYTVSLQVLPEPTASIASAPSVCMGYTGSVTLTGTPLATITYSVIPGTTHSSTLNASGTSIANLGSISSPVRFTLINATSGACTATEDTTITIAAQVQQWLGRASDDWNTAANWGCGFVPVATNNVVIPAGTPNTATLGSSGAAVVNGLTLNSGAAVIVNAGSTLSLNGNLINNGSISGAGTTELTGTTAQQISGYGKMANVTISNIAGVSMASMADSLSITGTLAVLSGTFNTMGTLIIVVDSDGTGGRIGQLTGGHITGNVIMKQWIPSGRRAYRFWGHPFSTNIPLSQLGQYIDVTGTGGSANGFTNTRTNAPSAFWYDTHCANASLTSDPGWIPFLTATPNATLTPTDSNFIKPTEGIRIMIRGSKGQGLDGLPYCPDATTICQYGTINTGNINIPIRNYGAGRAYNQISNPYPSPVDIGTIINNAASNDEILGSLYYVWNPYIGTAGAYQNIAIGSPYYLQPNASFQVRASTSASVSPVYLNFSESNKTADVSTFGGLLRTIPKFTQLTVYDTNYHQYDSWYMSLNSEATDGEDTKLDGGKAVNPDLNFYSWSSDKTKLAADARPYVTGNTIPLGFYSDIVSDFIIKVDAYTANEDAELYLHDNLLQTYTKLTEGAEYRFKVTNELKSQGDLRFEITMGTKDLHKEVNARPFQISIVPNPATDDVCLSFSSGTIENTCVKITDISGICVYQQDLGSTDGGKVNVSLEHFSAGMYMVEFTSGSIKVIRRLIKD